MRVLAVAGPHAGDSGRRTHSEPDASAEVEVRWDSSGWKSRYPRAMLVAEDSHDAARFVRCPWLAAEHDPAILGRGHTYELPCQVHWPAWRDRCPDCRAQAADRAEQDHWREP